jgi:hypothetical protein
MSKIVSAVISILLLVLVDRAAMQWKRIRAGSNGGGHRSVSTLSNETRRAVAPQRASFTNILTVNIIGTGKH